MGRPALLFLLTLCLAAPLSARAQGGSGATLCAVAYNDANRNQTRDPGELPLPNVSISLLVQVAGSSVVVANDVTDTQKGQTCFKNLAPGQYALSFSAPLAAATTPTTFTVTLGKDEQATREFGAIPDDQAAATPPGFVIVLTRQNRIALAVGAALLVMALSVGIGLVLRGFYALVTRR